MRTFFHTFLLLLCALLATSCYSVYTLREAGWNAAEQGNYAEAVAYYTKALAMDSSCYSCYLERSYAYRQLRRRFDAILDLDSAIALAPTKASGYYRRASLYYNIGRYDKAIEDYTTLTTLDRNNPIPYLYLGKSLVYCKRYEEALYNYNRILRDVPNYYYALAARADLYVQQEEYNRALDDYSSAIEALDQEIHTARQVYPYTSIRPSVAKEQIHQAELRVEELSHTLARYFRARANTYQTLQQYDLALESYSESLLWDSTATVAHTNIGWLHYLANDFTACIASSQTAVRLDSNALSARYNIALSYLRLGDTEKAWQQYRATLAYVGNNTYSPSSPQHALLISTATLERKAAINGIQNLVQRNIYAEQARAILRELFGEKLGKE